VNRLGTGIEWFISNGAPRYADLEKIEYPVQREVKFFAFRFCKSLGKGIVEQLLKRTKLVGTHDGGSLVVPTHLKVRMVVGGWYYLKSLQTTK
jgi:hypothetical protein